MKEKFFRRILHSFGKKTPSVFVKIECQILLDLMARSCKEPREDLLFLSKEKALERYGTYTKRCMEKGDTDPGKLYEEAFRLGRKIAKISGFSDPKDKEELIFYLYSNIGITMKGRLPGDIEVPVCYFSRIYDVRQCALMSNVDAGIIAGIIGQGRLVFYERLSEGCRACKAHFGKEETI